jgi:proteic killer suppression protein
MRFRHTNKILKKLDEEADFDGGFSVSLVKKFRMRMQSIRAAADENDLRAMKSNHFEKLKGDRKGDYSIRLNDQFRLTFQIEKTDDGNQIVVLDIEDYH